MDVAKDYSFLDPDSALFHAWVVDALDVTRASSCTDIDARRAMKFAQRIGGLVCEAFIFSSM